MFNKRQSNKERLNYPRDTMNKLIELERLMKKNESGKKNK